VPIGSCAGGAATADDSATTADDSTAVADDSTAATDDTATTDDSTATTDDTAATDDTSVADDSSADDTTPAEVVDAPEGRTCEVTSGLIADFEEGSAAVLEIEGRIGLFEGYGDESGTINAAVEDEGTEECNSGVFHATGSGFSSYAGVGTVFNGTYNTEKEEYEPIVYDGSQFNAIQFRAKKGSGQQNAVRFSLSTPWTEGGDFSDGSCTDSMDVDNPCWNHLGHFLIDDEELGTDWRTYTFCFDRDLYPMFLPTHVTSAQRKQVSSNLLKLQFQFNQGFDTDGEQHSLSDSFDFYLDDVRFVNSECAPSGLFQSTDGASMPFPQNQPIGSCSLPADADIFNEAVSEAYSRWKSIHVMNGNQVWSNEDSRTISESQAYGMLISAAMGDKQLFDALLGYWESNTEGGSSLMRWTNGGSGTATDADTDAAFALLMADAQWGGYSGKAGNLINDARSMDVSGSFLTPGSNYPGMNADAFNASYFSPSFYRSFGGWDDVISSGYSELNRCTNAFQGQIPSDWCDGGQAVPPSSIPVEVTSLNGDMAYAFDAARTPFRIGLDACVAGGEASTYISSLVGFFASKYGGGEDINLMVSGYDQSGNEHMEAEDNQMSFIGPIGVGAMGAGDTATMEKAFRATLDIMERPEFYNTYYPTTVGLMSLLVLTGNFPHP
jgi:hypothetical protein